MIQSSNFSELNRQFARLEIETVSGRICRLGESLVDVEGLARLLKIGDRVRLETKAGRSVGAEVVALNSEKASVFPESRTEGLAIGDRAIYCGQSSIAPDPSWVGHTLDAFGNAMDGTRLRDGDRSYPLRASPPNAMDRKPLGGRLETGLAVLNTFLPIARGQRIGVFAGSGVGKTTLLGKLAKTVSADVVVLVLIGERGREVRDFVEKILGPDAMTRCVVVAATSDQSPAIKRRALFSAMSIAECLRDAGAHVLFIADSLTRFAEAHREVASACGEVTSMRGFPPSTSSLLMELVERAGPGEHDAGDITAVFSVLVAGSDLEEPISDITRGILDGHIILSREIAARGRFPAIDVLQSVSRSLPDAASTGENEILYQARTLLSAYERSRLMIESGLYTQGSNSEIDKACQVNEELERFLSRVESISIVESFQRLYKVIQ
ncbi:FliI/YscN family ATPase [Tropicimonas sp. S265A]|uniref:FliI/YscN family ATPase n=1 Tax=Tropicimonas sp. S265A TaxID=3415134 RepID=UPI003C7A12A0